MRETPKTTRLLQTLKSRCLMAIPALMLFLIASFEGNCQPFHNSQWYQFDYDVKHYSTKVIPGSPNQRESVMGGTKFDANGLGEPHFIQLNDGFPTPNTQYPEIVTDVLYPDAKFVDQRTKDIVIKAPNEYFMVVSARVDRNNPLQAAPYRDKIRVINVDGGGNIIAEKIIEDITPPTGGNDWGYSLYPESAMYRLVEDPSNPGSYHDALYICGYVVTEDYLYPKYPNFQAPKMSFILWLDISNANPINWTVMGSNYFETSPVFGVTTLNNPEVDFDIAMRMQNIEQGTYANTAIPEDDDIFLTGSVNAKTGPFNGPDNGQPYTNIRSATMINVLNPWNLQRRITGNRHIVDEGNGDGFGFMEYGIGLVQTNNGQDNYIVSNTYFDYPTGYGVEPNSWNNLLGFNATPDRIAVTHLQALFLTATGAGNLVREYLSSGSQGAFALQVLPSNETPTNSGNASAVTFNIAGMAYYAPNPCWTAMSPYNRVSRANMVPFLFNVDIDFSIPTGFTGNINYNPYNPLGPNFGSYMTLFPNQTGTGDPTMFNNTYANLGDGLSYIAWNPKFADVEFAGSTELVMNAPKWDPNTNRLGLKTLFVDITGGGVHAMTSPCPVPVCDPGSDEFSVEIVGDAEATPNIGESDQMEGPGFMSYSLGGDCMGLGSPSTYKPASINKVQENTITHLFPNPASDHIMIAPGADILNSENITIQLVNMQGQHISTLYNGQTSDMSRKHRLLLPYLPSGLYIIQATNEKGHRVYHERITVNQ